MAQRDEQNGWYFSAAGFRQIGQGLSALVML